MKSTLRIALPALAITLGLTYSANAQLLQFDATGELINGPLGSYAEGTALSITGVVDIGLANAAPNVLSSNRVEFDPTALKSMSVTVGAETITFNSLGFGNVGIVQTDNIGSGSLQTEQVQFDVVAAPRAGGGVDLVWDGTLSGSTITEVSFDLTVLNRTYGSYLEDSLYGDITKLFSSVGPGSSPVLAVDPFTGVGRQGEPISFGRFSGGAQASTVGSSGDSVLSSFQIDSVTFVPEPSSLALLGLGGLLLARRRRS